MRSPLPLRAHHGLCVQFFSGKGYSPGFTANMYKIAGELKGGAEVELKTSCDLICAECPNNCRGECRDPAKVYELDLRTLRAAGLSAGDVLSSADYLRIVREKIIAAGKQSEVCRDCEWRYLCK